jgi:hypothetical protein
VSAEKCAKILSLKFVPEALFEMGTLETFNLLAPEFYI